MLYKYYILHHKWVSKCFTNTRATLQSAVDAFYMFTHTLNTAVNITHVHMNVCIKLCWEHNSVKVMDSKNYQKLQNSRWPRQLQIRLTNFTKLSSTCAHITHTHTAQHSTAFCQQHAVTFKIISYSCHSNSLQDSYLYLTTKKQPTELTLTWQY